jgi:predicted ribosomally synthesized peptide with nif11-like leader
MSIAEIQRFAADVNSNAALHAEAEKIYAQASQVAPMVAFATAKGYGFTVGELKEQAKVKATAAGGKVSDAKLDGVSGGRAMFGGFADFWGSLFGGPI